MTTEEFEFMTTPFRHQMDEWLLSRDMEARGIWWEQGTGKTKLDIDEMAWLFLQGKINGHFIVAPNGVHRNWVTEEMPKHLSPLVRARMHWYSSDQHHTKSHQAAVDRLLSTPQEELAVLSMSFDSLMTEHGRAVAKKFLTTRKCMYSVDEARRIKEPTAKRTKRVLASGTYAPYRRILNGTPVANGPFDVYTQVLFLDPEFWKRHGISSFAGFKTTFANFRPITGPGGRTINVVDTYKNLDMLHRWLDEIGNRVTKEMVLPDLPPKLFTRCPYEMTSQQKKVYAQLRDEYMTELGGELITAPLALTRILRLQQVACGYLPNADGQFIHIPGGNPRLDIMQAWAEDLPHKAIVWARFRRDVDQVCEILGENAVRYDGSVDEEGRALALDRFQKPGGDAQFFVANPQAAGEGLTLHAAKSVWWHSMTFNLAEHLQAEDRAHRIGQDKSVEYRYAIAVGTVDERIAQCLSRKLDIASQVTGDSLREWLS